MFAKNQRLFRSYLYCSGTRLDLLEKACSSEADAVTVDLEDSVAKSLKNSARNAVVDHLAQRGTSKPLFVKTNPVSSDHGREDLEALASLTISGVRIPKVNDEDEVRTIHAILESKKFSGCAQLMLETASGIQNVDAIARTSSYTSLLIVGEEDLRNDLGCDRTELDYSLSRTVIAARAARLLPPVLSVWPFLEDPAGLEASAMKGKRMGFWGRLCVHPDQIPTINTVFTPSRMEVERARYVVEAFREAESAGKTAFKDKDGNYLSVWTKDNAERTLALSIALGGTDGAHLAPRGDRT